MICENCAEHIKRDEAYVKVVYGLKGHKGTLADWFHRDCEVAIRSRGCE